MKIEEMSIETANKLHDDVGISLEVNDGKVTAMVGEHEGNVLWRVYRYEI